MGNLNFQEPRSTSEALNSAHWKKAMYTKIEGFDRNNTLTLVPYDSKFNLVGNRWVFKIKRNIDGSIKKYKARLVAKGISSNSSIDFKETFSPVAKPYTIQIILNLVASHNWKIRQLDVNNAFLNGHLEECVYWYNLRVLSTRILNRAVNS